MLKSARSAVTLLMQLKKNFWKPGAFLFVLAGHEAQLLPALF